MSLETLSVWRARAALLILSVPERDWKIRKARVPWLARPLLLRLVHLSKEVLALKIYKAPGQPCLHLHKEDVHELPSRANWTSLLHLSLSLYSFFAFCAWIRFASPRMRVKADVYTRADQCFSLAKRRLFRFLVSLRLLEKYLVIHRTGMLEQHFETLWQRARGDLLRGGLIPFAVAALLG